MIRSSLSTRIPKSPNIPHLTRKCSTCRNTSPSSPLRGKTQIPATSLFTTANVTSPNSSSRGNTTQHLDNRDVLHLCVFPPRNTSPTPIVQRENQNHGQTNKMTNNSTMQESETLHDTLRTIKMTKDTVITSPKVKGQVPEISSSTPTVRLNLQVSTS